MRKFVVGLTGGIGSGKSTVERLFAALGITVVDADVIAREVVQPGSQALDHIARHFGQEILTAEGQLDRPRLRELVFANEQKRLWLEALLHPLIAEQIKAGIRDCQSPYCLLVSPLLLETAQVKLVDRVLVVDCSETLQLERALLRDGSDPETIRAIIRTQMPREDRLRQADDVLDNSGDLSALEEHVKSLHETYLDMAKSR